jgi:hypothetical protein
MTFLQLSVTKPHRFKFSKTFRTKTMFAFLVYDGIQDRNAVWTCR